MLKPETSLMVGLATAAVVYGVYTQATPPIADIRTTVQNNGDMTAANKSAAWLSAAVVAGISLIAKDPTVFIIGGAMVVGMSWWTEHANAVNPDSGKAAPQGDNAPEQFSDETMEQTEMYAASSNGLF